MPHHPSETQEFRPWHMLQPSETLEHLRVEPLAGLPPAEVDQRLREHGPNELVERGLKSPWRIVWEQATAVMSLVLLGAAAIKGVVAVLQGKPGEWIDAGAILVVVLLNVLLGFIQEYRAEKAMAALKNMAAPVVLAKGAGYLAEKIKETAKAHRVPVVENKFVARTLYTLVEIGKEIPADLYRAVAEVLALVYRAKGKTVST